MRAAPQAIGDGPWSDEQKEALHAALLSSDKERVTKKRGVMQQCLFFENPSGFAMPRECALTQQARIASRSTLTRARVLPNV